MLVAVGLTAVAAAACGTVRVAVDHWYEPTLDSSASAASADSPAGPASAADVATAGRATSAAALVDAHDCWTGAADMPADMRGQFPGHVVVTPASSGRTTYSADLVGPALDNVFDDDPSPAMTVHAFCR